MKNCFGVDWWLTANCKRQTQQEEEEEEEENEEEVCQQVQSAQCLVCGEWEQVSCVLVFRIDGENFNKCTRKSGDYRKTH